MTTRDDDDKPVVHPALGHVLWALAVIALTALAIWRRWSLLDDTPYPVGIDGYFYPIQLRAVLERGELAYPDFPLAFYLLAPFAALTDPIVGTKLGAAVLGGLAVLPTYALGARLGGSRAAGLVSAAIVATSAGGAFLAIEFVKNGIGVTVALTAVWLVLRALDPRSASTVADDTFSVRAMARSLRPHRVVLALIGIAAAALTHKLAITLVVTIAVPATIGALADGGALRGRRLLYAIIAFLLVATGVLAVLGGLGHARDAFSSTARWSAPALVSGPTFVLRFGYEALLAAVVAVLAAFTLAHRWGPDRSRATRAAAWVLAVLALVIALPWLAIDDPQGVGFRLRVIAFVPLALLAAVAIAGVAQRASLLGPTLLTTALPVAAALAIVVVAPARRDEGRVVPHPAMVASVSALAGVVPRGDTAIIPERHLMFMAVWYARVHAQLQPHGVAPAHRWRAITLSFIRAGSHLDSGLMAARRPDVLPAGLAPPIGLHPSHPNGFVLVREDTWQFVVSRLPPPERTRANAWPTI